MAINAPHVEHIVRDEQNDVTYRVMAYRQLSREEMIMGVRVYLSQVKKKDRPKKGQTVTIMSVIGA